MSVPRVDVPSIPGNPARRPGAGSTIVESDSTRRQCGDQTRRRAAKNAAFTRSPGWHVACKSTPANATPRGDAPEDPLRGPPRATRGGLTMKSRVGRACVVVLLGFAASPVMAQTADTAMTRAGEPVLA